MRVVFAYVPVIHKQVLDFFNTHKELPIWLLDNKAGQTENVYLERDARALSVSLIKEELAVHGFHNVSIIDQFALQEKAKEISEFIIPEDEIVRFFLEKYASSVPVAAKNIFIRWTQKLSTTENEVPLDRVISAEAFHKQVLTDLETEAQKSSDWWRQIAAAIVKNGKVVAQTHNKHLPTATTLAINGDPRSNLDAGKGPGIYTSIHAEAAAIASAAKRGVATEGCELYVTTFPCPSCARLAIEAGIKTIYYSKGYSVLDAEQILRQANIEIVLVQ